MKPCSLVVNMELLLRTNIFSYVSVSPLPLWIEFEQYRRTKTRVQQVYYFDHQARVSSLHSRDSRGCLSYKLRACILNPRHTVMTQTRIHHNSQHALSFCFTPHPSFFLSFHDTPPI